MASGRKAKTRAPQLLWSRWSWRERVMHIESWATLDAAIVHSYAAFVRGEAYTDSIRMPDDDTRLHHADQDGISADDQRDTLSEAWDEWLIRHPDLFAQLGKAETEEEDSALMEEIRTLIHGMKKTERQTTSRTITPARVAVMVAAEKPKVCYACGTRPAREGSAFCSDACAQVAAERYVQTTTRGWCGTCGTWIGSEGCPHAK